MNRFAVRLFYRVVRRTLLAGFVLALVVCLAFDSENMRGLLASVCGGDFVSEEREEDEAESALIAHSSLQRARRETRTHPRRASPVASGPPLYPASVSWATNFQPGIVRQPPLRC